MMIFRKVGNPQAFKSSTFRDEMRQAAEEMRKAMLDDFERTTATWEHAVKFESKIEMGAKVGGVKVSIWTEDLIYKFVDLGTKKHLIKPKKAGYPLKFKTGGEPKTTPKTILSVPGKKGDTPVRAMHVHHPGTKARQFTKIIKRTQSREFKQRAENAVRRFARRINGG